MSCGAVRMIEFAFLTGTLRSGHFVGDAGWSSWWRECVNVLSYKHICPYCLLLCANMSAFRFVCPLVYPPCAQSCIRSQSVLTGLLMSLEYISVHVLR